MVPPLWEYHVGIKDKDGDPPGTSPTYLSNGQPIPQNLPVEARGWSGQCYGANLRQKTVFSGIHCHYEWHILCEL